MLPAKVEVTLFYGSDVDIYIFAPSFAGSVTRRPRSGVWRFFRLKEPAVASADTEFARARDESARPRDEAARPRDESARPRAKCTMCGAEFVFHASTSSLLKHLLRYSTRPFRNSSVSSFRSCRGHQKGF
jgi:hypothetical protein